MLVTKTRVTEAGGLLVLTVQPVWFSEEHCLKKHKTGGKMPQWVRGAHNQAWPPEFQPHSLYGGRRGLTPTGGSLTSICVPCHRPA